MARALILALAVLLWSSPALAWEGIDGWHGECDWAGRVTVGWDNTCSSTEDTVGLCQDRIDNDGDGDTDCADSDCSAYCEFVLMQGGVDKVLQQDGTSFVNKQPQ